MLVCNLDDSGKDAENPITAIAGYIGRDTEWETFETNVEKWFDEFKAGILHAKDLHNTDGDFANWPVLRKQAFVARICQERNSCAMMGLSMAAEEVPYRNYKS